MNPAIDPTSNPFADQIVTSPRRAEPPIRGLNDSALHRLMMAFQRLLRPQAHAERAQLIISPAGGYGKSHLLGRLFREVGRRATRIYVRPFGDPETCWVSLLNGMVQDMLMPEKEEHAGRFAAPNQIDALAHGIFGELLARLVREGDYRADPAEAAIHRLTTQTLEKWDLSDPGSAWGQWAAQVLKDHEASPVREARLTELLLQSFPEGLSQNTRPQAWLRVLRRYACDRSDAATREACLAWMRGRTPVDAGEAALLGLLPSDGTDQSLGAHGRNEVARHRVLDLCALARLFRPFVLCFDQTEVYGRVPGMARTFGSVISDLVQGEGAHMCVITANSEVWTKQLEPGMDAAERDRILPAVTLQGLTRDQGRSLAHQRLRTVNAPEALRDRMLDDAWMEGLFARGQISARAFLQACEQRYDEVAAQLTKPNRASSLEALLEEAKAGIAASGLGSGQFRQDVFRWALLDVPSRGTSAFEVIAHKTDALGFDVEWKARHKRRFFVLEDSTHATTWRSIAKRAEALRADADAPAVTIALRLPWHHDIPQPSWQSTHPEIKVATHSSLCVVRVHQETMAEIYGTWELYTSACQADIPQSPEEVIRFAALRLDAWWTSLLGVEPVPAFAPITVSAAAILSPAPSAAPAGGKTIASALNEIIARRLFASFVQIQSELSDAVRRPVTLDEAVAAAQNMEDLRVYLHPNNAAFLWQR